MRLRDLLRLLVNQLPAPREDDERLREAEQRVNALDATIGAQQARKAGERELRDRRAEEGKRATR